MEEFQHQQPQTSYAAGTNIRDVNVRSINDNKLWVGTSRNRDSPSWYSYERSPKRERSVKMVSKSHKSTSWWNDPEMKRKRRVAKYKLYAAEGKIKRSVKQGFRWLKIKCIKIVTNL